MGPLAVLAAAGGFIGAAGALYQGSAERAAAEYNSRLLNLQAQQIREKARSDSNQASIGARKTIGEMRANFAASGVTMEGSPLDVMEESVKYAQRDILNIKNQGEMDARMKEYEAKLTRFQGKSAQTASYFSAASALTSGGSSAYKYKDL